MRILHVENDSAAAAAVEVMLQDLTSDYRCTASGEEALSLAQEHAFDLILLDVMLPDIDGYDLLGRLRGAGIYTPCLILSGLVDRNSEFANLALGVRDYLVKPFTRDELIRSIHAVISRARELSGAPVEEIPSHQGGRPYDGVERRKFRRFATVKVATIDYGSGVSCRVVNLAHGGAGLRLLDESQRLPHSFMLQFESGEARFCRVVWRNGDRMGVKFIDQ